MTRPYFSTGTLDRMRATAERAMPDTCDILDSARDRAPVYLGVPCGVGNLGTPFLTSRGVDRPEVSAQWLFRLPAGTDVRPDWQAVMAADTASPGLRGRVFVIVGDTPASNEIVRSVYATEAQA